MENENLKNKTRALFITYGDAHHSSSRIRAVQYFKLFQTEMNFRITWIPRAKKLHQSGSLYKIFVFPFTKRIQSLRRYFHISFCKYDIVFIQRFFLESSLIDKLKQKKTIIVYDFDDAIYIDNNNGSNEKNTNRMIDSADLVIVSSPVLEEYCRARNKNTNVMLANTPVDIDRFSQETKKPNPKVIIGWTGSKHTTPYLESIGTALEKLGRVRDYKLLSVGAAQPFFKGIDHREIQWTHDNETQALEQMDIGIMPLPDNDFAKGKGGYKLFLFMAAGIPVVASPVGINQQIIHHGENGFLAANDEEWIKYLTELIDNPELRERMGKAGRKMAESNYDRKVIFASIKNEIKKLLQHE